MSIVRTAYAFSPTSITGCVLWMDAADSSTITLSSTAITQWNDKSSSGNNFVQATTANSPTIGTSANGLPTVYFASANQQLVSSQNNATSGNASRTVIQIFWCPTLSSAYYSVTGTESGANPAQAWGHAKNANSDVTYPFAYSSVGNDVYTFVYSTPNPLVTYAQYDSTTSSLNSYYATLGATGGTTTVGNFTTKSCTFNTTAGVWYLGRRQQAATGSITSHLLEMIHFNKALSATERQQVEGYLIQKWALTGLLSAGHPGLTTTVYQSSYLKTAGPKRNIATMTPFYTAFSPRKITGCSHWFDATDSSTITLSSGSLTQWNDKSGNGRNLTAVSGYANATVSSAFQNRLNVFNFFGNGLYRTALGNVSYPLEVYIIVALKSLTTHVDVLGMGDTATDNFNSLTFSESAARRWHNGSSFGYRQTISTTDETSLSFLLIQWSIANGNYLLRRNGTQLIQASQTYSFNNSATAAFQIGFRHTNIDAANFSGYIGEIVVFNNQIGTTDRQNVESYLAQKWGLTASLPGGHLQLTQPAGARTGLSLANSRITIIPVLSITLKYTYTGSNQSFVVPSGVTSVNVYMWGAGGGAGLGAGGGAGCYVQGVLPVIPGETLTIVVGQGGGNKASSFGKTYGGGGSGGGLDTGRSDIVSSQGGGRSAIVRSATDLVTAAAGGGGRGGRGGRGRLVTGEVGTGVATGGTQSAGGTNNGAIYSGGNANQDNSAGGGSGYYGGGGGNQDQAGGGGSCLTSNLSLLAGESTYGTESSDGVLAPQTSSPYYNSDVAFGATSSYGYNYGSGGNGLVVVSFSSKTSVSLTYSRLILSAWYGSVAYRYGLDVTTTVNNAFGGNPSNTITLSLATFTDPQIGTTKYTFIVYMFNGIQKFSSAYAEGTVLTFSSLT